MLSELILPVQPVLEIYFKSEEDLIDLMAMCAATGILNREHVFHVFNIEDRERVFRKLNERVDEVVAAFRVMEENV